MSPNEALAKIKALDKAGPFTEDQWFDPNAIRAILADVSPEPHVIDREKARQIVQRYVADLGMGRFTPMSEVLDQIEKSIEPRGLVLSDKEATKLRRLIYEHSPQNDRVMMRLHDRIEASSAD